VYARRTFLPSMSARRKRCWPTGSPRMWVLLGSEKRKSRVSCDSSTRFSSGSVAYLPFSSVIGLASAAVAGFGSLTATTGMSEVGEEPASSPM